MDKILEYAYFGQKLRTSHDPRPLQRSLIVDQSLTKPTNEHVSPMRAFLNDNKGMLPQSSIANMEKVILQHEEEKNIQHKMIEVKMKKAVTVASPSPLSTSI